MVLRDRTAVCHFETGKNPQLPEQVRSKFVPGIENLVGYVSDGFDKFCRRLMTDPNADPGEDDLTLDFVSKETMRVVCEEAALRSGLAPICVIVGLADLWPLMRRGRLAGLDLSLLFGNGSNPRTYAAPKFLTEIVRLNAGTTGVVLQFDADVAADEVGVACVVRAVLAAQDLGTAWFHSGGYRGPQRIADPVNFKATRTVFTAYWRWFLGDLAEVGPESDPTFARSPAGDRLVSIRGNSRRRMSPQAISGAGLSYSPEICRWIPQAKCFGQNIPWCDDDMLRKLAEVAGLVSPAAPESLGGVQFVQDRYPGGPPSEKDILWHETTYFHRLLTGCMLNALIGDARRAGPLGEAVADRITTGRTVPGDSLRIALTAAAAEACKITLQLWADFAEADPKGRLPYWAEDHNNETFHAEVTEAVVRDAMRYVKLVEQWPDWVDLIENTPMFA